jgi:hypothetical protein
LPEQWKESIFVPIYKKGDKTVCSNYQGVSLLSEEIIGDQCGFRRKRSITHHIFCSHQILEKKLEYSEAVHQLFIDFKKAYDSVRREVL